MMPFKLRLKHAMLAVAALLLLAWTIGGYIMLRVIMSLVSLLIIVFSISVSLVGFWVITSLLDPMPAYPQGLYDHQKRIVPDEREAGEHCPICVRPDTEMYFGSHRDAEGKGVKTDPYSPHDPYDLSNSTVDKE